MYPYYQHLISPAGSNGVMVIVVDNELLKHELEHYKILLDKVQVMSTITMWVMKYDWMVQCFNVLYGVSGLSLLHDIK